MPRTGAGDYPTRLVWLPQQQKQDATYGGIKHNWPAAKQQEFWARVDEAGGAAVVIEGVTVSKTDVEIHIRVPTRRGIVFGPNDRFQDKATLEVYIAQSARRGPGWTDAVVMAQRQRPPEGTVNG